MNQTVLAFLCLLFPLIDASDRSKESDTVRREDFEEHFELSNSGIPVVRVAPSAPTFPGGLRRTRVLHSLARRSCTMLSYIAY